VNGYLFPKDDIKVLTSIISKVVARGKLTPLAHQVASIGKGTATNLMVAEAVEGYASLLENILRLPSEVAAPKPVAEIPSQFKNEWQWNILNVVSDARYGSRNASSHLFLEKIEELWNHKKADTPNTSAKDEEFLYTIWEEQKQTDFIIARKRREDDEVR